MRWTHRRAFRATGAREGSMAGKAGLPSHRDQVPSSPYLHGAGALPQLFRGKPAFPQNESELPRGEKTLGWDSTRKGGSSWPSGPLLTCRGTPASPGGIPFGQGGHSLFQNRRIPSSMKGKPRHEDRKETAPQSGKKGGKGGHWEQNRERNSGLS